MVCKRLLLIISLLISLYSDCFADEFTRFNTKPLRSRFGMEFTAYPAGQIYGLRAEFLNRRFWQLNLRVGYNRAFRKDFSGLNDNEQGGGLGLSLGIRSLPLYGLGFGTDNFDGVPFIGTRVDYWRMNIFWKDKHDLPTTGTTKIDVLQPTLEAGIEFTFYRKWLVTVYGGIGQEINMFTKGKEVGQGGMWLGGITFCRNLVGLKKRKVD